MNVRLDPHTHSRFWFDGFAEPSAMIEMAKARGLQGLAITDHDTWRCVDWFERMGALNRDGLPIDGFLIIPGQVISTAEGHLLALGVRLPDLRGIPAREAVDLVQTLGGVAIAAHPLDRFRHGISLSTRDTLQLDGIEIFNAACTFPQHNAWASAYAAGRGLAGTGGNDAHFLRCGQQRLDRGRSRETDLGERPRSGSGGENHRAGKPLHSQATGTEISFVVRPEIQIRRTGVILDDLHQGGG